MTEYIYSTVNMDIDVQSTYTFNPSMNSYPLTQGNCVYTIGTDIKTVRESSSVTLDSTISIAS